MAELFCVRIIVAEVSFSMGVLGGCSVKKLGPKKLEISGGGSVLEISGGGYKFVDK